ncbi:MAG: MerR family transcriptional regulator [Pseudonocardiaceae bacterium]
MLPSSGMSNSIPSLPIEVFMRMAELSDRTGVPVPTIKYYMREGLLSPGERTSPNQARYDEGHIRRLKLIRALVDIGGLSIAATRAVLARLDSPDVGALETLGQVQYSLSPAREHVEDEAWRAAGDEVDRLLTRYGWKVCATNPAWAALIEVIAVLHRLGQQDFLGLLDNYATAARTVADADVELVSARELLEDRAEGVVVAAVLGDAVLASLRRLAQEDLIVRRLSTNGDNPPA